MPIYELPLKIRQGDTGDELQVTLGKSFEKYTDLSTVDIELIAKTPDQRLIKQPVTDKSGNTFKVKFPDEMYAKTGVFRNMYFKIGDDSTSDIKLVVLQGIGSIKEAGSYIDDFETLIEQGQSYVLALKDFADTGNSKIDNKVAELTGKMQSFVDKSKEDLDAAKKAWNKFQNKSETAAIDQRDSFDKTFKKFISDNQTSVDALKSDLTSTTSAGTKQNSDNQAAFNSAQKKRATDFTNSQEANATAFTDAQDKRTSDFNSQKAGFETRFKSYLDKLQDDYDSFKLVLTTDVSDLNNQLKKVGTDVSALDAKANEISEKLQDVDLSQMATNKANITKLQADVKTNTGKFASYTTTADLNSKIATGVGQAKTYAEQSIKDIIGTAPENMDTIAELADAVTENKDGVQAINDGITKKADKTDVTALQNTVQAMITPISQDDYDALVSDGTVDPKILYVILDA
ncbi:MAG: phage tail protein [Lactobacillus sp.]|nr:phage tail protein [Lactobacillus sp.]